MRIIQFESSTACNLRCIFCPRYDMTRKMGEMSDELFHKIIKEGKELGVKIFSPFLNGEPFIFPRIYQWLDYMQDQGVQAILYTNGEYLDVDKLIKYKNIRYVNCSFNGATAETCAKVGRGKQDFVKVREKIQDLIRRAPFKVQVSMVVTEDNQHEVPLFRKQWGRKAKIRPFVNWAGYRHSTIEKTSGPRVPCYSLLYHMTILWDGRVCLCCMDYDGHVILGDINKQSIREIWDSYSILRIRHRALDFDMDLCRNCNFNMA